MRTVTITRFGAPDVLDLIDVPVPDPGPGEVSIDVTAASVTLADVLMRRGVFGGTPPLVPGLEVAGTVRAVGDGVTALSPGRPVVTLSRPTAGGYADVSLSPAHIVLPIDDLDPARAVVAVPNVATGLLTLTAVAPLPEGGRVLVHGASGALGSVVAQVARTLGAARVDGTVRRPDQLDPATRVMFDHIFTPEGLTAHPGEHYHVILDPVGGSLRTASLGLLTPLGRLVALGNASGEDNAVDTTMLWLGNAAVAGLNAGFLFGSDPVLAQTHGRRAVELVRTTAIDVPFDRLPLGQARAAQERLEGAGVARRQVLDLTR
jgi:NADPH2:quinone reductase